MANRVLDRHRNRAIAIFSLAGIVAGVWALDLGGIMAVPSWMTPRSPLGILVIWVPIFAGQAYLLMAQRRLKRRLRQTGGSLCPGCAYDLRGTEGMGACPECGLENDLVKLQKAWKDLRWKG